MIIFGWQHDANMLALSLAAPRSQNPGTKIESHALASSEEVVSRGCEQVTAPVRETAAQALGAVARVLSRGQASSVLGHLGQLTKSSEWCVRHGGFLGIKYLLAARGESLGEMLPTALPLAIAGLQVCYRSRRQMIGPAALFPALTCCLAGALLRSS